MRLTHTLAFIVGVLSLGIGCVPPKPVVVPPAVLVRAVAVVVTDGEQRLVNATVLLEDVPSNQKGATGADGVITFPRVNAATEHTNVHVSLPGCQPYVEPAVLTAGINQQIDIGGPLTTPNAVMLPPLNCHVDPSAISLQKLAAIRGSMWTARLNLPYGPRPNRDDNILPMLFYGLYSQDQRDAMLTQYKDERHYTHYVTGPVTGNDCYHELYPCLQGLPSQAQFDAFLDTVEDLWDQGETPVYFHKPDGWETPDHASDLDKLDALVMQPRAQKLLRIVVYPGWEPSGSKYGWPNAQWVEMLQRGARVFPNALRLLHTPADLDAPVGGNDDHVPGLTNGKAWANVAPYIHGWLGQWGGYVDGSNPQPTPEFLAEWQKVFCGSSGFIARFGDPALYPDWPKGSAFGPNQPLRVYAGEYAAYGNFWKNFPEAPSIQLGDLAMQCADGYMDGGSVPVPVR